MAGTTTSPKLRPSSEGGSSKRAGRYVLGDLLGRGGMAEVFSGHVMGDHGFQKPVAIKRLLPELANDEVFVERLIQEAKLLVGLQHGNIVSVLDLARDGEDVFLVMDFVDGPSLRQLLKARGTRGLPLGVASYIVQSAAQGLEFAHARPGGAIIHADISPSNILLTTSGEVRVADFGIARRENTGEGIVEGKWAYMAPEQARGEALAPRSDVFALGVVLYELITGAHPFGRQVTADERESQQLTVIPPRVVRPSVPHGLDQICMKALAMVARDRYASMQQMIDALLDERFANQWREGASDLAQAIRECSPDGASPASAGPRTMITDRPVTIVTRSLISQTPASTSAAATRGSGSAQVAAVAPDEATPAPMPPQVYELPAALRIDGPAMPAWGTAVPAQDLASVHGGTAHSVHVAAAPVDPGRSNKWPIVVMSTAAVLGVIAAVALQMRPTEVEAQPATSQPVVRPEPARPVTAPSAEPPAARAPTVATVSETVGQEPVKSEEPAPAAPPEDVATTEAAAPPVTEPRPRPRKETPAKKATGSLRVNAFPWAYVSVDGGGRREANQGKIPLSAGRHTVKVWNDDGGRKTVVVTIEPNRFTTVKVNFEDDTVETN
ncbi:MAG: protein kinase [Myxococcales bacterium]|nr:protein kinase [Myxococcales bacterium]